MPKNEYKDKYKFYLTLKKKGKSQTGLQEANKNHNKP